MHTRFLNTVTILKKEHLYVVFQNTEKDCNLIENSKKIAVLSG